MKPRELHIFVPQWARPGLSFARWLSDRGYSRLSRAVTAALPHRYYTVGYDHSLERELRAGRPIELNERGKPWLNG